MISPTLYSSASDDWATPPELFARVARKYGPFDLDVAASPENAKWGRYYTREQDGLALPWVGRVWCNPPYGRAIGRWVRKAVESARAGATVVMLLTARTDTQWWHDYVKPFGRVEFLKGRVRFGQATNSAPFPPAIVVFQSVQQSYCKQCEKPYIPAQSDAEFCSAGCRQAAYRARHVTAISVTRGPADAGRPSSPRIWPQPLDEPRNDL